MATILLTKSLRAKLMKECYARNACISNTSAIELFSRRRYASQRSATGSELIKEKLGNKAVLTLNRGASNNSLTLELTNEIIATLKEWENDSQIASIIFKAKGDVFCTGIDFAAAANKQSTGPGVLESSFKLQYKLGTLKKPNATLINGLVYSSAIGVTFNHTYSVSTENAVFSLPETGYGLVPNCFFASRIPDKLGLYLALSGESIKGRDLYNVGLTTHYIRAAKLQNLENDLQKSADIDAVIDGINRYRKKGENYKRETIVNFYRIYELMNTVKSIDDIFGVLKSKGDEWSKQQLTLLSQRSPLALKITYKFFEDHKCEKSEKNKACDLKECLTTHYRITKRLISGQDVQQSLRSGMVEKQSNTKWSKALNEIDEKTVNSFFEPLPNDELKLD